MCYRIKQMNKYIDITLIGVYPQNKSNKNRNWRNKKKDHVVLIEIKGI